MHVVYVHKAIMHMPECAQDQHVDTKKYTWYHEEQAETTAIGHCMLTKNLILGHHVHAANGCTCMPKYAYRGIPYLPNIHAKSILHECQKQ
jgi:hypothetical protein